MILCPEELSFKFDVQNNCLFMNFEGVLNSQKFVQTREYIFAQPDFHTQINRFVDLSRCDFDLNPAQLEKLSMSIRLHEKQDIVVSTPYHVVVLVGDALGHGIMRTLHSLIGSEEINLKIIRVSEQGANLQGINFLNLPSDYVLPDFIAISDKYSKASS